MDLMGHFEGQNNLQVLDLGSGIGRNSIPIAQKIRNTSSTVTCVELLNSALTKLQTYSKEHDVFEVIKQNKQQLKTIILTLTLMIISLQYPVQNISNQKKILKRTSFYEKSDKNGGINCLIINSNIQEIDLKRMKNQKL